MRIKDSYNYASPQYSRLYEPSRAVSKAYGEGNKWLDQLKEYVYIVQGMPNLSRLIHENAHKQLEYLDEFGDVLHQRHLMQFYPTVEELALEDEVSDVDGVFNLLIRTFDHIQEALMSFRNAANQANLLPLALKTEELMVKNSNDYTVFLELWARWDTDGGSKTSFDGLCEEYLEGKED